MWPCQPHNSHTKPGRVGAAHRAAQPKPKGRAKAEEPSDHNASLLPNPSSAVGCREHSLTSLCFRPHPTATSTATTTPCSPK